jgi:rubrerythrin
MKTGFKTFAEVISFAVMREEESYEFYTDLAQKTTDPFIQQIFKEFAKEELKHKNMLLDMDGTGIEKIFESISEKLDDLNISERFQNMEPDPEMDFQQALIIAMKREEKSCDLYSLLAELTEADDLSLMLAAIAKEEARHRLRIETTYKEIYNK